MGAATLGDPGGAGFERTQALDREISTHGRLVRQSAATRCSGDLIRPERTWRPTTLASCRYGQRRHGRDSALFEEHADGNHVLRTARIR